MKLLRESDVWGKSCTVSHLALETVVRAEKRHPTCQQSTLCSWFIVQSVVVDVVLAVQWHILSHDCANL